jgi:hypothetical protein
MSGFRVSSVPCRRLGFLGSTILAGATGLTLVACSGSVAPAQDKDAPIGIETSQLSIVIENKVGMPLLDVDVAIVPVGRATLFNKLIGRLENAEKRDLRPGDFYGRDGTSFSLRVVRPQAVRVTAKDLNGKAYKVETPWR